MAGAALRRHRRPGRRAADDRLQGVRRLAADAARARAGRHSSSSPSSPTRPTRSARGWPGAEFVRDGRRSPRSARAGPALIWLNSPSNPTGRVLPVEHLRKVVAWARERGTVVASDECYLDAGWDAAAGARSCTRTSAAATTTGLLAVHSLSQASNLAGYRAGFVTGDPALVAALLEVRKHAGMMVPRPGAGGDGGRGVRRRARRRPARAATPRRRALLRAALEAAGLQIEHSEAGLYLWATAAEPGLRTTVAAARRAGASWSRPGSSTGRPESATCAWP